MLSIREATQEDDDAIWNILEPVMRQGETYALPRTISREAALAYWRQAGNHVFVAEDAGAIVGTYILRANQQGGGSHVSNCGYVTSQAATGCGVASAMCRDSLERAAASGFRAMQFNFVVSTNDRAVRLWQRHGFEIAGRLPQAFLHPKLGYVDALVMFRSL